MATRSLIAASAVAYQASAFTATIIKPVITPWKTQNTAFRIRNAGTLYSSTFSTVPTEEEGDAGSDHEADSTLAAMKSMQRRTTCTKTAAPASESSLHHQAELISFDPFGFASETSAATVAPSPAADSDTPSKFSFAGMSDVWKARGFVMAAAALYGTNFTLVKILNEHLPVGASTSLRFILASLALMPFFFMKEERSVEEKAHEDTPLDLIATIPAVLAGMEVGFYNSVGYIAQAVGLETTDASKSAFICSLAVVVVPLLDLVFGKTKGLKLSAIAGILFAVCGVGLLELAGASSTQELLHLSNGELCTFLQPLFFGIGFWRMEDSMRKFPTEAKRLTAGQLLAVAIVSVANCWLIAPTVMEHFPALAQTAGMVAAPTWAQISSWLSDPMILAALVWTGVVTTAFTIYMETMALKTISAAEATLYFSTEPLWGAAFASVVAGERLGPAAMVGAGLILTGCTVSTVGGEEEEEVAVPETEQENVLAFAEASAPRDDKLAMISKPLLPSASLIGSALLQTKFIVDLRHALQIAVDETGHDEFANTSDVIASFADNVAIVEAIRAAALLVGENVRQTFDP